MSLQVQFITMGYMFGSGLILGVLYDVYRVVSMRIRLPRWMIPLIDFAYWIAATVIVFYLLYYSNLGQVRVFIFLAVFSGISFYFALLSTTICKLLQGIVNILVWLYRLIVRIVTVLVVRPAAFLYRILVILFGFFIAIIVFIGKIVLQLLYPLRWLGRILKLGKLISWLKRYF